MQYDTWQQRLGANYSDDMEFDTATPEPQEVEKVIMEPHPVFDEIELVCIMW